MIRSPSQTFALETTPVPLSLDTARGVLQPTPVSSQRDASTTTYVRHRREENLATTEDRVSSLETGQAVTNVKLDHIVKTLDSLVVKVEDLGDTVMKAQAVSTASRGVAGYFKPVIFAFIGAVLAALGFYPHAVK